MANLKNPMDRVKEAVINPQKFPKEVFPKVLQDISGNLDKHLNFPESFTMFSMLSVAAITAGASVRASFKTGWSVPLVFYGALVGRPGVTKSHPMKWAFKPLKDEQKRRYKEYREELKQYNEQVKNGQQAEKPVLKQLYIKDATVEAVSLVHSSNINGVGIAPDELAGFFKSHNRYRPGNDQQYYLSGFDADQIIVNRATKEPLIIEESNINIIGTIQPDVLRVIFDKQDDDGMIDRFLFVLPESQLKKEWRETNLSGKYAKDWERIIHNIMGISESSKDIEYSFSKEANRILHEWQKENTRKCNKRDTSDRQRSLYAKLETYIPRFSLVLHVLKVATGEATGTEVQAKSAKGAIQLVEYFRYTGENIQSDIYNKTPADRLPDAQKRIYEELPDEFTREDSFKIADRLGISRRTTDTLRSNRDVIQKKGRVFFKLF